jgi:hypothetical protein
MIDELEWTCMESVVTYFTYCSSICMEGLKKTLEISLMIAGLHAKIWI